MKRTIYLLALLWLFTKNILAQIYTGPIPKPTSGYGSDGTYSVAVVSFSNPNFPTENIQIYYPSGITSKVPTIFYSHGFGGNNPANVMGLLNFVAKKGYAIVFVPYQTIGPNITQRYNNLLSGFIKSARDFPSIIDTTKVGFMGHSFGGGASFANAFHCFTNLSWGQSGRFIFASAQWYSYFISQNELQSFPSNVKLVTMVYDNDSTNDHRMAADIFNNINVPTSEKDFLLVKSDTISGYPYSAIHGVPNTASDFNALDYYAIYRPLDALCDYVFNGNLAAKPVALGNGSLSQVAMPGGLENLVQSDQPIAQHPESAYTYPCSDNSNPRNNYCMQTVSVQKTLSESTQVLMFPNPSSSQINIGSEHIIKTCKVYNSLGVQVLSERNISSYEYKLDVGHLPKGIYFLELNAGEEKNLVRKFVVDQN